MAVNPEFSEHIIGLLEQALGSVSSKPMFGGIGIYHHGVFFAGMWSDELLLRLDEGDEPEYLRHGFTANDPDSTGKNRKRYYVVPSEILDSREELERWARRSIEFIARHAKAKRKAARKPKRK